MSKFRNVGNNVKSFKRKKTHIKKRLYGEYKIIQRESLFNDLGTTN